jgi:hypothetical protein
MSGRQYRRDDTPPPSGPKLKVIRIKANEGCNVALFGTVVHGFWTHYGGRTEPCTEPREHCEGCQKQWPSRWKGYVHCLREDTLQEGFLELTKLNRDTILSHTGSEKLMRGSRLKLQRGKGDKTALRMLLLRGWGAEHPGEEMPEEHDPEDTLRSLFEWRRPKAD